VILDEEIGGKDEVPLPLHIVDGQVDRVKRLDPSRLQIVHIVSVVDMPIDVDFVVANP
jgi:hypothetical protein